MKIETLKAKQLKKVCEQNKYFIVRDFNNYSMAFNSKAMNCAMKKSNYKPEAYTRWISYRPCSFQEYITRKRPFL